MRRKKSILVAVISAAAVAGISFGLADNWYPSRWGAADQRDGYQLSAWPNEMPAAATTTATRTLFLPRMLEPSLPV